MILYFYLKIVPINGARITSNWCYDVGLNSDLVTTYNVPLLNSEHYESSVLTEESSDIIGYTKV